VSERLDAIIRFNLVTQDLDRLAAFYRDVLHLAPLGAECRIGCWEMNLLGLPGSGRRQAFAVGSQVLALDQFETPGAPYPPGGDAASLGFQHLALQVGDMGAAYVQLRGIAAISLGGPQTLPASSGGVQAFKFRDPDGHPLEFLSKPGGGNTATRPLTEGRQLVSGIDHSAISVSDANASLRFYEDRGLRPGKRTLNRGPEQERLDDLVGVEVEVLPMIPPRPAPHLELLGYRTPRGRREALPSVNDVAATRIVWHGTPDALIRDPDGHLHQLHQEAHHA
jgi:catechol 2,3-dioxygenase-like lactoylglutathione lyase family enzyme